MTIWGRKIFPTFFIPINQKIVVLIKYVIFHNKNVLFLQPVKVVNIYFYTFYRFWIVQELEFPAREEERIKML
jgi:hypothetical protein